MSAQQLYDEYMITSMVAGFEPIEVGSARACTLVGEDGREYLDAFSGIAVVNCGHGHPRVLEAAREQMEKLVHCGTYLYYNPAAARLARRLAEIGPGRLQKSFFATSGAEALEGSMRLAKQFTGRREFIALGHSFHGRSYATLSLSGARGRKQGGGPYMGGVAFAPAPYLYRCPFGSRDEVECAERSAEYLHEVIRTQTSGDVAAVVVEPVLGEGGILVAPDLYLQRVREITSDLGALLVVDEVQTGFGRTGRMFAIEHAGVEPDVMAMAKGIAGGFPLSAFITRPDVADAFRPGDHLSTFGGNPVSCAAATASIGVLEDESLAANAAARGEQLLARLRSFQPTCPLVGDVRGRGLMIGLELVLDRDRTPAPKAAVEVRRACREAGVLIGVGGTYGNVARIQPPLCLSEAEAERIADTVERALASIQV